jgi:hypothetical protein
MLHKETVTSDTLALIRRFQADEVFINFRLVGGTALALKIGHRISVYIDLFSSEAFMNESILHHLELNYGFQMQFMHKNTLKGIINNVFVDILTHPYRFIRPEEGIEGVKMASSEDIAAMKVNAITGNGTRVKDFIDLYFLLQQFTLAEILGFYMEKYDQKNDFHAFKSICYFDDTDFEPWPRMLLQNDLTPLKLRKSLEIHREEYLRHAKLSR